MPWTTLKNINILIVEDSPTSALALQNMLNTMLHEEWFCKIKTTLKDTIIYLRSNHPDIILLDLTLPNGQGLSVLEDLMKITDTIPVIVITGDSAESTAIEALGKGAQDYLIKGLFTTVDLFKAIRNALRRNIFRQNLIALHVDGIKASKRGEEIQAAFDSKKR